MIADDTNAIRDGLRRLAQQKVIAEAEAAKRAEADSKPTELRKPGELFPEAGAPFRGFFLAEDGEPVSISPHHSLSDAFADLVLTTACSDAVMVRTADISALSAHLISAGFVTRCGVIDDTDPWDNVTLDDGSYMWGQL